LDLWGRGCKALAPAEYMMADASGLWRPGKYCHKPGRRGAP
jgi:hypothetical protein